ncbi:MAG: hypothetical protein HY721_14095, partial [Planctomycetes bacterium]|nr:hypothetical protein [Planctomycetota bacterium]
MAKKTVTKGTKHVKKASASKSASKRLRWLSSTGAPLIDDYARRLGSFLEAVADGEV